MDMQPKHISAGPTAAWSFGLMLGYWVAIQWPKYAGRRISRSVVQH